MCKINTITSSHKLFQQRLSRLADPPKRINYIGEKINVDTPLVGIVGSRKPTPYGTEMTYRLAYDLAKRGVSVVSGLAIGVDGVAHQAALDAGGITIAVLAGGLDSIYPQRHHKLAQQIVKQGGCLVSEYEEGTPALPHQFVARNRIIATLSDAILVTEAAKKSGSIHTAHFALDLGLPVMAIPGLATNPMAQGTHNLLKAGATLVTTVQDISFALGYQEPHHQAAQPSLFTSSPEEGVILALLQEGISDGESLLVRSSLDAPTFSHVLTMLEINGTIKALGGNQWTIVG